MKRKAVCAAALLSIASVLSVAAQLPSLTVTKRLNSPIVVRQGTATQLRYIISVANAPGAGTATGVTIRDNLADMAPGITFSPGTAFANLDGGATGGAANSGTSTNLIFGPFVLPGGSNVEINFQVAFAATVPAAVYNNSAQVRFLDPTSGTPAEVSPGGTYSNGIPVSGSNYDGASASADNVPVVTTNTRPVAVANSYTTRQSITRYGNVITDNSGGTDSDLEGGPLRITSTSVTTPGGGTLVMAPTGQFSYTPAPGFATLATGPQDFTFTYIIEDINGNVSDPATVTVTVTPLPDADGDGIADITDLDDDNDGLLDITEAGGICSGSSVIGTDNLIANGDFSQGTPATLTPVPQYVAPGAPWGGGFWTSGVGYAGYNVYPSDTRIAIQRGTIRYLPNFNPTDPGGFRIIQSPFLGDAPFNVPPSDTYLYSNGNSTGQQYVICRQTVNGLNPNRKYILVSYTSNSINPALGANVAPDDGIMQFYADDQPVGEAFVVYKDGDPRSGHGGRDLWDRRQVVFQASTNSAVFELRDGQLGVEGDDFVITYAGVFPFNDFGCAGLPADPSGDEDNDGTANWQDADDPALGAPGLTNGIRTAFAGLDPDGDGVLSQFDLDSDGDGCFDALESGQTSVAAANIRGRNGTVPGPYGENGVSSALELFSTTGGQNVETGTLNYTAVKTGATFNFLNRTVFTACSNNAPLAQNVTRTIRRNTTANPSAYTFPASDFQGVFTDADGNTLQSILIATLPANGTLTFNGTPVTVLPAGGLEIPVSQIAQLVFTPAVDAPAASPYTSFTFRVRDNTGVFSTNASTFTFNTIDLLAVDDLPAGAPAASIITGTAAAVDVLANDTRPAGNAVTLLLVSQSDPCFTPTPINNGTAAPTFSVNTAACATGTYTFVYAFRDDATGVVSNQATVTFTVVPPPVPTPVSKIIVVRVNTAAAPSAYTFSQTPGFGGTADFSFTSGTLPLVSVVITQLPAATDGVLTLAGAPVLLNAVIPAALIPNLVFTPAQDRAGAPNPTLQYQAIDNLATTSTDAGTITFLLIRAVDDVNPPDLTAVNVLGNDATSSLGTVSVRITQQPCPPAVTVTLNPDGTLRYAGGCPPGPLVIEYVFDVLLPDGTVVTSNPAQVRFTVTVPATQDRAVTTVVNVQRPFTATDFPLTGGTGTLGAVVVKTLPAEGTLFFSGNPVTTLPVGGLVVPAAQVGQLVFFPDANESNVPYTTFTFAVRDNIGTESAVQTMTVNVIQAIADGTAAAPAALIVPGQTAPVAVITNDIRTGTPATLNPATGQSSNCFTATPNSAAGTYTVNVAGCPVGIYTFNYTFTQDGVTSNAAIVTFRVLPTTPVLNAGAAVAVTFPEDNARDAGVNVRFDDAAPEVDFVNKVNASYTSISALTGVRIASLPARGELLLNGVPVTVGQDITYAQLNGLVFRPAANANGNAYTTFTVQAANSAGMSDDALTVTINLRPVNDAPVAANDSLYVTNVNTVLINPAPSILANDNDALDGSTLAATPVTDGPTVRGGTITIRTDGTFTYTPPAGFTGRDSVQYQVCDSGIPLPALCANAFIKFRVNAPPVSPPAAKVSDTLVNPNRLAADVRTVTLRKPLFATDADSEPRPDGTIANYTVLSLPPAAQGVLLLNGTPVAAGQVLTPAQAAQLAFRPAPLFSGTATFTYGATDADGGASQPITYTMVIINRPVAVDDRAIVLPNSQDAAIPVARGRSGTAEGRDTDPDQATLAALSGLDTNTVRILDQPVNGTATVRNGTVLYTPRNGFRGRDSLTYIICDRTLATVGHPQTGPLCDTAVVRIEVREPFVPEGFSPNGDGTHDFFVVENPYNESIELKVFNRWGSLVYETADFKQDEIVYGPGDEVTNFSSARSEWGGTANRGLRVGEELPDGTYFYIIKYKTSGYSKARYMTLMR